MNQKTKIIPGDWFSDENGYHVTVMAVADGWCMVREGTNKPYILPEELVLATFDDTEQMTDAAPMKDQSLPKGTILKFKGIPVELLEDTTVKSETDLASAEFITPENWREDADFYAKIFPNNESKSDL